MIVGAFALGGAAFAAIGIRTWGPAEATRPGAASEAPPEAAASASHAELAPTRSSDSSLIDYVAAAEAAAAEDFSALLMSPPGLPDGDMFPLLKVAPLYPPEAAARRLEGHAVVEFTVTARGDIADAEIVESSDSVFDRPTLEAIRQSKYKPRIVDGRAVPVEGVRTKFSYALEPRPAPEEAIREESGADSGARAAGTTRRGAAGERELGSADGSPESADDDGMSWRAFRALLAPALECLQPADLRCIELTLDEVSAANTLSPREEAEIARIYGFVHYRQGNYERAIEAYRKAAGPSGDRETAWWSARTLMTIARIHYERGQYQQALDAAMEYLKTSEPAGTDVYVFVDRLRQLGAVVR